MSLVLWSPSYHHLINFILSTFIIIVVVVVDGVDFFFVNQKPTKEKWRHFSCLAVALTQ